jgi:hypothetical protein
MGLILLILFLFLFVVTGPYWGYHSWGWGPSGGFGLIFLVLLVLYLAGYFPRR